MRHLYSDLPAALDEQQLAREQAIRTVLARAETVAASGDAVPSPCVSVCRVQAETGLCGGCYRTLSEISGWSRSGAAAQRVLWQKIVQRIGPAAGTGG